MIFTISVLMQFALWFLPFIAPLFWRGPWLIAG